MKLKILSIILFLLIISLSCAKKNRTIDPAYRIVVDIGRFNSHQEAAIAEHKIDWSGTDIASNNACTESYGAQELRCFLCKLSESDTNNSSNFKIVPLKRKLPSKSIILCNLSQPNLSPQIEKIIKKNALLQTLKEVESFAIIPEGKKLFIIGKDRVGTLYGIYDLLESFGVRWYEPGKIGEVVPIIKQIAISKNARE